MKRPVSFADSDLHTRGESLFVDDLPHPEGLLFASVLTSSIAHGRIRKLDAGGAEKLPGVRGVFTARDIPGENQIGGTVPDEPLLAVGEVHFIGQPVALVVADSASIARSAVRKIVLDLEPLPAVFDPREACAQGELIVPPRTISLGEVDSAFQKCEVIVEGKVESGGQEHIYLETQAALVLPREDGGVKVISSTQSPTQGQRIIARLLGLPMHKVEVDVQRLGGAFGGKEDQAVPWAGMAALAAFRLKRPVKLVLRRQEDIRCTGKRHPYSSDYRIGLSDSGEILAFEVTFYQNAGAAADLSPAILGRTLFHATGSYYIPNVKITGYSCRTNLPPNTAFRGFGGPQGMFVIEAAIFNAAAVLGVEPAFIQKKNLLKDGDRFPYGMEVKNSTARRAWERAEELYAPGEWRRKVEEFNSAHRLQKKGLAFMPVCFGISFTATVLNQAGALVHVYTDGSVSVSTAAVEMGQGVKSKILQVAAKVFSIDIARIRLESTNTTRVANTSPTAASTGADLNGKATELACQAILMRLRKVAAEELELKDPEIAGSEAAFQPKVTIENEVVCYGGKPTQLKWEELVAAAYQKRVNLSAQAHYATPGIHYDPSKEKGEPFAYHVYGTAVTEVTLDCLRGTYTIDAVKVVHDCGESINPLIDRGQAEGAIVQGIGWLTMEELVYAADGRLLADSMTNYKIPDLHSAPREISFHFLEDSTNPLGILNSKAIGEPPFMYGIGAFYALLAAMKAFRPGLEVSVVTPLTPERVLLALYGVREEKPAGVRSMGVSAEGS